MRVITVLFTATAATVAGCAHRTPASSAAPSGIVGTPHSLADDGWLAAWSGSADTLHRTAFLALFDLRQGSPTAGHIVRVVPAGPGTRGTHHTEHQLASDGLLFANDFGAGRSFIFDLTDPARARLHAAFTTAGPFGWPHSFVRLPNGNRLVTYQWQASAFNRPPGGLAEARTDGSVVRWAGAHTAEAADREITPYSLEVLPKLDRVVSTSTSMVSDNGVHVQIWRLSDLALLHTLRIPGEHDMSDPAHAAMAHHLFPGEPRVLEDGHTVMLATFNCGMFRVTGVDSDAPVIAPVYSFPGRDCAVPVVIGHWWLQTVPALHAVVVLDVSDSRAPREVSRVVLGDSVAPHWLSAERSGRRLVVDSGSPRDSRLYLLRFDVVTGALARDPEFPTLDMAEVEVPGVGTVRGVPHGAVFAR